MTAIRKWRLVLVAGLLSPMAANADVISIAENLVDNGFYTTDTSTGLDWLDLTISANIAYSAAEAANPGWRYASNAEVEGIFAMFFEPTFVDPGNGYQESTSADSLAEAALFVSLMGSTFSDGSYYVALGNYLDEDNILRGMGTEVILDTVTGIVGPEWGVEYGDRARRAYGSYLVRASVPEPGSLALFGIGLMGLVFSRWRKKL